MSENWDFYQLLVDDEPASIYVDLGLAKTAPLPISPHMAYLRVTMRQPRPDGLSSNEEFDALLRLEDKLREGVSRNGVGPFVGRNTSGGYRDFYFYTADPVAFEDAATAAMAALPEYEFETGHRPDPDWDVYFGFLYPSEDDLQRIWNRRVVDSLSGHGDILDEPRIIDHLAYLPTGAAAASLRDYLHGQEFEVDVPEIRSGSIALNFKRADLPHAMDNIVIPIARRIRELGGAYDGWGCEVVK